MWLLSLTIYIASQYEKRDAPFFNALSDCPALTWRTVYKLINIPWNYDRLAKHKNMPLDILLKWNKTTLCYVSQNPNLTYEIVKQNISRSWDFAKLTINESIPLEAEWLIPRLVIERKDCYRVFREQKFSKLRDEIFAIYNDDFTHISDKSGELIPIINEFLPEYLSLNIQTWLYDVVPYIDNVRELNTPRLCKYASLKKNINIDTILNFPGVCWDWKCLSCHPNISLHDIMNNPELPWCWFTVFKRRDITWEVAQMLIPHATNSLSPKKKDSDIFLIPLALSLPWKDIEENRRIFHCGYDNIISYNRNITWAIVRRTKYVDWSFYYSCPSRNY